MLSGVVWTLWVLNFFGFKWFIYIHIYMYTYKLMNLLSSRCWGGADINSSPLGQNGPHFADDIFRCIFVNENFCILIKISLKFVPRGPIDNNQAFVKIMAWRRISDKPSFEPMLTGFTDSYIRHLEEMSWIWKPSSWNDNVPFMLLKSQL